MRSKQVLTIAAGSVVALLAAVYFSVHSPRPRANLLDAPAPAEPATPGIESRELIAAKHIADCRFYEGKPQYQEALAECMNGRANAQKRIDAAEKALSGCNENDMGMRYFKATKEAAKRGDVDAQLCYLQGDFFSPEGAEIFTEAELEEYKKVAPRYVDAALKRGDWRVVDLLNTRHFHPGSGPVRLIDGVDQEPYDRPSRCRKMSEPGSMIMSMSG